MPNVDAAASPAFKLVATTGHVNAQNGIRYPASVPVAAPAPGSPKAVGTCHRAGLYATSMRPPAKSHAPWRKPKLQAIPGTRVGE